MAPETKTQEVRHNAVLPRRTVDLFKIKENSLDVVFVNKGASEKRFKTEVIERTASSKGGTVTQGTA